MLVDPSPLVVEADEVADYDPATLRSALRTAPTVTVLVGRTPDAVGDAFDIRVDQPDGVDSVARTVADHPLAALALVALLRSTEDVDPWSGLVSESAAYAALLGGADFHRWLATRPPPGPRSDRPRVVLEREGDTLRLVLDRPEAHNAVDRAMRDALVEALQLAAADDQIARIELSGAGPSFSSGGDLDEFGTVGDPPTAHAVRLTRHPGWWMHVCADRVVARLHGACIGAGIELPAFARRVVTTPDAFFALPEVGMGLIPGAGGTVSLTRRIGRQRCAWMALTGERVDAATAMEWGLVDEIDELSPRRPGGASGR